MSYKLSAIVLGGTSFVYEGESKAFWDINGAPCIAYPINALYEYDQIERIYVIGPDHNSDKTNLGEKPDPSYREQRKKEELLLDRIISEIDGDQNRIFRCLDQGGITKNIYEGVRNIEKVLLEEKAERGEIREEDIPHLSWEQKQSSLSEEVVFVVFGDHPLLNQATIEELIKRYRYLEERFDASVYIPMISEQCLNFEHPGGVPLIVGRDRTKEEMQEMTLYGGCGFIFKPWRLRSTIPIILEGFHGTQHYGFTALSKIAGAIGKALWYHPTDLLRYLRLLPRGLYIAGTFFPAHEYKFDEQTVPSRLRLLRPFVKALFKYRTLYRGLHVNKLEKCLSAALYPRRTDAIKALEPLVYFLHPFPESFPPAVSAKIDIILPSDEIDDIARRASFDIDDEVTHYALTTALSICPQGLPELPQLPESLYILK
jgi:hypothetical protein